MQWRAWSLEKVQQRWRTTLCQEPCQVLHNSSWGIRSGGTMSINLILSYGNASARLPLQSLLCRLRFLPLNHVCWISFHISPWRASSYALGGCIFRPHFLGGCIFRPQCWWIHCLPQGLYFFTGHHRRTELPHGVTESWLLAVVLWLYMASFCRSYSRLPYSHGATPLDEAWALIPGSTWTHPEYLSPREQIPNRESLWSEVCLPLPHFLLWDLPFLLVILVKIAFLSLPKDTTLDSIARINCPSIHTKSVHTMLYS